MNESASVAQGRESDADADHRMPSWREVFLYFLFLGFVNIGGPVTKITMMFNHMVEKRRWLSKDRFVKIMAFCHMLPGPEALQLGIYVGYLKEKTSRQSSGGSHVHHSGRGGDDCFELALCEIRQAGTGQRCSLRSETCRPRDHRRGDYQVGPGLDPQLVSRLVADWLVCRDMVLGR